MPKALICNLTRDQLNARALASARRADAGEALPEADYLLNFENPVDAYRAVTPERFRLLAVLQAAGPADGLRAGATLGAPLQQRPRGRERAGGDRPDRARRRGRSRSLGGRGMAVEHRASRVRERRFQRWAGRNTDGETIEFEVRGHVRGLGEPKMLDGLARRGRDIQITGGPARGRTTPGRVAVVLR